MFRGRHEPTGLEASVEVVSYDDYPVVEWTAWFTNPTDSPSAILERPLALDASFRGDGPVLRHCNGDFASKDGYVWQSSALPDGDRVEMEPYLGRPCDRAFPYFRLVFGDCGMTFAVGWPGQWHARASWRRRFGRGSGRPGRRPAVPPARGIGPHTAHDPDGVVR